MTHPWRQTGYFTKRPRTQSDYILADLKAGMKITPLQALQDYGTLRLAARINDLRKLGHNIKSTPVKVKTRMGFSIVSEYTMGQTNETD